VFVVESCCDGDLVSRFEVVEGVKIGAEVVEMVVKWLVLDFGFLPAAWLFALDLAGAFVPAVPSLDNGSFRRVFRPFLFGRKFESSS
jgi:hypothetical protein